MNYWTQASHAALMTFGLSLFTIFSSTGFALAQSAAPEAATPETFSPILMDRLNGPRVFGSDYRYDLGPVGTVEIGLSLADFMPGRFPQVLSLLANEDETSTAFRVQIGGAGTKLGVWDGIEGRYLDYDFRDGGYFHIAISVRNSQTDVIINGDHVGRLDIGFGSATEAPLIVGGQQDGRFSVFGEVHFVRLWDLDLTVDILRQTERFNGRPTGLGKVQDHLVAYSEFTDRRAEMHFTRPLVELDRLMAGLTGNPDAPGEPKFIDLPSGAMINGLSAIFGATLRGFGLQYIDAAGEQHDDFIIYGKSGLQNNWVCDDQGNCSATPDRLEAERFEDPKRLTGYESMHAPGGGITAIRLGFEDGTYSSWVGNFGDDHMLETVTLPNRNSEVAQLAFAGEGDIRATGLAYTPLPDDHDITGRWTVRGWPGPRKMQGSQSDDVGGGLLHGSYSDEMVAALEVKDGGRRLVANFSGVLGATGGGQSARITEFVLGFDGRYYEPDGTVFEIVDDDMILMSDKWETVALVKVPPLVRLSGKDHNFNAFGGTFNLDHQIPFNGHIFRGFDVGHMDPANLQDMNALRGRVFREPAAGSLDFYTSYRKNIPFGLLHFPDIQERSRANTHSIQSSQDYRTESSQSVGLNIGVPKVASFGYNHEVKRRMGQQSSSKSQMSITRDVHTERALLIDRRYMELDAEFERHILDLSRTFKLTGKIDALPLIAEYGTHYARAMTIGTVRTDIMRFSSSAYGQMRGKGTTIGVEASATVKRAKLGLTYSESNSFDKENNRQVENQFEEVAAVGESGNPVPVLMDLRRLDDLLAPPYFSDPVILDDVRDVVSDAIDKYLEAAANEPLAPADIWEPYFFELSIGDMIAYELSDAEIESVGLDNVVSPGPPRSYSGSLFVTGPGDQTLWDVPLYIGTTSAFRPTKFHSRSKRVFMATASQLCGTDGEEKAQAGFGAELSIAWASDTASYGPGMKLFALKEGEPPKRQWFKFFNKQTAPYGVKMEALAKRLPNLNGEFKEMPKCP